MTVLPYKPPEYLGQKKTGAALEVGGVLVVCSL